MRVVLLSSVSILGLVGCANDPEYIPAPMTMEAGVADAMGALSEAKASLTLPIKTETASDRAKRDALAAMLMVDVPYVRLGDLEIDVEWTITNLDAKAAQARIELNGANEYFSYDPSIIVLNPDDEEAPPTPGLDGDIPIDVPASGTVSGIFTEDDLREAAIDLDQITRGNVNPFRATLMVNKNVGSFQPMTPPDPTSMEPMMGQVPIGAPIPREAFAGITRIDLVFKPEAHMTLEYNIRIRDLRGIMHDLLLTAATEKPDELQPFTPAVYNVTAPTP